VSWQQPFSVGKAKLQLLKGELSVWVGWAWTSGCEGGRGHIQLGPRGRDGGLDNGRATGKSDQVTDDSNL
jgi:hypothetical protein